MIEKIETMIKGLGETPIDSLCTWFPGISKESIIAEINKSNILIIKDNVVCINRQAGINEKERIENSDGNKDFNYENIDKKNKEMSYEDILAIIDNYNATVKEKFEKLIGNTFDNKLQAIIKYYEEKYTVIPNTLKINGETKVFSLLHKKKDIELAYLVITQCLTEDILNEMSEKLPDETVYFCVLNELQCKFDKGLREFYIKDTEEILKEYMIKYKLEKEQKEVLKITEVKGD